MTTLILRLAAPLQSWGTSSRFTRRNTDRVPSKSGIVGLLAAADGRRRSDPIEDLAALRIGVRVEQPGQIERDFQTARPIDGSSPLPLSYRFYLADAVFVAAIEGDENLLEGLRDALRQPVFPLYLGRRSCPPAGRLLLELRPGGIREALREVTWQASALTQRQHRGPTVTLETVVDCDPAAAGVMLVRDEPLSFDPSHRRYGWRSVLRSNVTIPNPAHVPPRVNAPGTDGHDPMEPLGGGG